MQVLTVQTAQDTLERLKRRPFDGLCELVWNALDADSKRVDIEIESSDFEGIRAIRVVDDGHGIELTVANQAFGQLGGSEKKARIHSPGGRLYHGRHGRGRYRALGLGELMRWRSTFSDPFGTWRFDIRIHAGSLNRPEIEAAVATSENIGCVVEIANVYREANALLTPELLTQIGGVFAPYLVAHPEVALSVNGTTVDVASRMEDEVLVDLSDAEGEARLRIIFWRDGNLNEFHLCRLDGMPVFSERGPKVSGLPYTAFLESALYDERAQEDANLGGLDEGPSALQKRARAALQREVRKRLAMRAAHTVDQLQEEGIYPYSGTPKDEREKAEREIFAVAAEVVHALSPSLSSATGPERKLKMQVLAAVVDEEPSARERIVQKVFALDEESARTFAELIDRVPLTSIISLAKTVVERLDFLDALHHLVYDAENRKRLRERSQLHKILEPHCWIFGEGFGIGRSDATLRSMLKAHLSILGRQDISEVLAFDDQELELSMDRIPDLMLYRQTPGSHGSLDHLVVELKRPSVSLGRTEFDQILDYADAVANHPGFDKDRVRWQFVVVSSGVVERDYRQRAKSKDRPEGVIEVGDNFTVKAYTWGQVIQDARSRMEFIRERLDYNPPDQEQAMAMLRSSVPHLIPQGGL